MSQYHLDIFEDIYDIKDNITDGQFLTLNNKVKNLIQENENLKQSLSNYTRVDEEFYDFEPEIIDEQSVVPSQDIRNVCICSTRYVFPNRCNTEEHDLSEFFCVQSYERMVNCENFKKLMEKLPLLENIFRKIDLPFTEEPIYQDYIKHEIVLIGHILLFFIKKVYEKKDKTIITFVMFDFMIRNINFMKDHKLYTTTCITKLEELLAYSEYIPLTIEYNVNYTKWLDIMKNIIVPE